LDELILDISGQINPLAVTVESACYITLHDGNSLIDHNGQELSFVEVFHTINEIIIPIHLEFVLQKI
jgi:hypothetical protein